MRTELDPATLLEHRNFVRAIAKRMRCIMNSAERYERPVCR